jgi:hypothetical protein
MTNQISKISSIITLSALLFASCKDKEDIKKDETQYGNKTGEFQIAFAVGSDGNSTTYVQGKDDISSGEINFNQYGFEVPSTRTARFYASTDGSVVYNLDYGGGMIYRFAYNGGQNYQQTHQTNVYVTMGTNNPRWTKIDDNYALIHNASAEIKYTDTTNTIFKERTSKITINLVNLKSLDIEKNVNYEFVLDGEYTNNNYAITRIDAPVVANGKVYYGLTMNKYLPQFDSTVSGFINTATLVLDYPSLENPTIIKTNIAKGATNGYRTPNAHVTESGDIYQVSDDGKQTTFLKITNGQYDESYSFDFSAAIGRKTSTNGWFYAGNGIGYIPYLKADLGGKATANWGLARVDLNSKSVVDLEVPANLWLQQYQYSVVRDGIFYIALSPVGGEGHIYMFDVKSTAPNAYTLGAKISTGADAFYIGIF